MREQSDRARSLQSLLVASLVVALFCLTVSFGPALVVGGSAKRSAAADVLQENRVAGMAAVPSAGSVLAKSDDLPLQPR